MTDKIVFVNQEQNLGEMNRIELKEIFDIISSHVAKLRSAN